MLPLRASACACPSLPLDVRGFVAPMRHGRGTAPVFATGRRRTLKIAVRDRAKRDERKRGMPGGCGLHLPEEMRERRPDGTRFLALRELAFHAPAQVAVNGCDGVDVDHGPAVDLQERFRIERVDPFLDRFVYKRLAPRPDRTRVQR